MNKKQKGGKYVPVANMYAPYVTTKYRERQLKKAKRLTKKAEKQEKKAAETKAYTKEKYGEELLFAFQPSGKRARKRAEKAKAKAKAGSRKAYRKGKKEGIYKTGGFIEPPIEQI
tara:strand:- start:960 stop:1304 length:345 start_codon:yes stop_codon:yes gene_type:complete